MNMQVNSVKEFVVQFDTSDITASTVVIFGEMTNYDSVSSLEYYVEKSSTWVSLLKDDGIGNMTVSTSVLTGGMKLRVSFSEVDTYTFTTGIIVVDASTSSLDVKSVVSVEFNVIDEEEGTPFEDVYEMFLNSLGETDYINLTEEELMEELLPILKKAIFYLCRIAKVAGFELHERDDENNRFLQVLSEHEIVVLGYAMVLCWTEQQLNSNRFVNMAYFDAGIKTYSPNETMKNLLVLSETYDKRLRNKLTEYNYKVVDISQFGGK